MAVSSILNFIDYVSQIPPSCGCSAPTLHDGAGLFPFGANDCNTIVQQLPASLGCDSEPGVRSANVELTFLFGLELQAAARGKKSRKDTTECACHEGTILVALALETGILTGLQDNERQ